MCSLIDFFFSRTEHGDSSHKEQFSVLGELSTNNVILPDVVDVAQSNVGSIDCNTTNGRNLQKNKKKKI
jgi:hypothetical protein